MRTALQNPANSTNHYEAHVGERIGQERYIVKAHGIRAILASYRTKEEADDCLSKDPLAADEYLVTEWWDGQEWMQ